MQILRLKAVKTRMGYPSDTSVYNGIRDGVIPLGVSIGERAKGWPDYEVDAIIKARIAGKSEAEIRKLVEVMHSNRKGLLAEGPSTP